MIDDQVMSFDVLVRNLEAVTFADLHLQFFIDQLVERFLARRRLVGGNLDQFDALIDIERGDRLAVDEHQDRLGGCAAMRRERQADGDHEGRRQAREAMGGS